MADWRTISDTEVDPDAPVTSELAYAFRDNPIAIAEGQAGAPRIADAALGPAANATNAGRNWVLARYGLAEFGAIGTFALARRTNNVTNNPGEIAPGSLLSPTSVGGPPQGVLTGSWQCMGRTSGGNTDAERTTLWLRVS